MTVRYNIFFSGLALLAGFLLVFSAFFTAALSVYADGREFPARDRGDTGRTTEPAPTLSATLPRQCLAPRDARRLSAARKSIQRRGGDKSRNIYQIFFFLPKYEG